MTHFAAHTISEIPSVNGIGLMRTDETLTAAELRQRAHVELLRQEAIAQGLLADDDPVPSDGATSEAASAAIESLISQAVVTPEPDRETCLRFHAANPAKFAHGERVHARHILFAVTPGVDVNALRKRAEAHLIDLRASGKTDVNAFSIAANQLSNCPSGKTGGDLGWLLQSDCAPEFARELFGKPEVGVLPRLVQSRFGFHVVEVLAREPGNTPAFDQCEGAVRMLLMQQSFATALRQYLQQLAARATIQHFELDASASPLMQ
jgi:peptidyl-prolyl cis-trans isomerase C